jgi:thioesterase domain-containing protein
MSVGSKPGGRVDRDELERYLHEHIPLSAAMGVTVRFATAQSVALAAPLAPNINHRETAFGGSVSALAILAGWSLVRVRLAARRPKCRIVIQRNCIEYDAPITGDFWAISTLAEPAAWERFERMLERHGRARVRVVCAVESAEGSCARFEGSFVAIDTPAPRGEGVR